MDYLITKYKLTHFKQYTRTFIKIKNFIYGELKIETLTVQLDRG